MTPRSLVPTRAGAALGAFLSGALLSGPALGEPMDESAIALDARAMNQEFASANFRAARKSLEKAIAGCKRGCTGAVRGRVHRDLAVVLITGFEDVSSAEEHFRLAIAADPNLSLDPTFTTAAVGEAYTRVRQQAPRAEAHEDASGGTGEARRGSSDGTADVRPVAEQQVGVPLPIYVELADGHRRKLKARVHFRIAGSTKWQALTLEKVSRGYGAELPCSSMSKEGTLEYYVDFKDEDGERVLSAGSKEEPFQTEIKKERVPRPPHLPHRPPPSACPPEPVHCRTDAECGGMACENGVCEAPKAPSRFLVSVGIAQDFPIVSGKDVCTKSSQLNDGFSCFRASGSQYHGAPVPGVSDVISGGFVVATTRVLVGVDYAVSNGFSLGARVGYTLRGGGPAPDGGSPYLPLLAEARVAHWFGGTGGRTLSPYLVASAGVAQVDAMRDTFVQEDRSVPPPPNQIDNPDVQKLTAWKKMGRAFAGLGGGAYLPITRQTGLTGELRGMVLFPDSGFNAQLTLGYGAWL